MRIHMLALAAVFVARAAAGAETPEAVYAKFHAAALAGNFAEMKKHGTPEGAAEIERMPPGQRQAALDFLRGILPRSYSITGREPSADGNRIVLRATGMATGLLSPKPVPHYGTIALVKLGGDWKVQESSWKNTPGPGVTPALAGPPPAPAKAAVAAEPARPAAVQRATRPVQPAAAAAAPAARPKLAGDCVYKPVMTDEEIARCR
jgi:hypothetical protein